VAVAKLAHPLREAIDAHVIGDLIEIGIRGAGVITRNTSLFDPGWWQLPGSEKRYRDWKKWGHIPV
jgi:penicillin-binding protein 2